MEPLQVVSDSAQRTRSIAAGVAALLRPGDVVVLSGELGGGKTTFVQGAARALGSTDLVTSPTFTIVQEYDAPFAIAHVDVYRLHHLQEVHDLGFDEMIDEGRITFIEWGELIAPLLPSDHVVVRFDAMAGEHERLVTLVPHGRRWLANHDALAAALVGATC